MKMAQEAVARRHGPIQCPVPRSGSRRATENDAIADHLIRLAHSQRNRGVGSCFLHLRNVTGSPMHGITSAFTGVTTPEPANPAEEAYCAEKTGAACLRQTGGQSRRQTNHGQWTSCTTRYVLVGTFDGSMCSTTTIVKGLASKLIIAAG